MLKTFKILVGFIALLCASMPVKSASVNELTILAESSKSTYTFTFDSTTDVLQTALFSNPQLGVDPIQVTSLIGSTIVGSFLGSFGSPVTQKFDDFGFSGQPFFEPGPTPIGVSVGIIPNGIFFQTTDDVVAGGFLSLAGIGIQDKFVADTFVFQSFLIIERTIPSNNTSAPEPTSVALLMMGLACFGPLRKKATQT